MRSPKTYVILLLAATTVGGALLAWKQYGELVELRAANMNRDERADLQKRIWDLEKLSRELQDKLAAQRDPATEGESVATNVPDGERRPERRGEPGGPRGGRGDPRDWAAGALQQVNAVRELLSKPEVQAMMALQQKAGIEQRYAALFKNLNLTPQQADKLTGLLAERATTMQDVASIAREQGIDPRQNPEAFRKLVTDTQNQINASIKATIGEQGFAQLSNYEQTLPQRNLVNDLQQRLSYTSTPLTSAQAEQLVQILAATAPPRAERPANANPPGTSSPAGPGPGPGRGDGGRGFGPPGPPGGPGPRGPDIGGILANAMGGGPGVAMLMGGSDQGRGGGTATVTPAAVTQAQAVLTPPQVSALQQIQQQQQAQQQLRQLINETVSAHQPANAPGGTPPGGTPPPRKRPGGG